jgi:NAD+ kinase
MTGPFKRIGLFAKHNSRAIVDTFEKLIAYLEKRGHTLSVEAQSATLLSDPLFKKNHSIVSRETLGEVSDLVIVVGGDGSFLNAARAVVPFNVPMLGVNRGRLGFLTDISPEDIEKDLTPILEGEYAKEQRSLIRVKIERDGRCIEEGDALNDIVLFGGSLARMIEFDITINKVFVVRQLSDGLIIATPTGSTAYSLSGGGPILYPTLNALVLVSMYPHTLSNRPIVIEDSSTIELRVAETNITNLKISGDGQWHFELIPGDSIHIEKHPHQLILIHPKDYDYFSVLRQKLGWNTSQIKQ